MVLAIVLIVLALLLFGGSFIGGALHFLLWIAIILLLVGMFFGWRGRSRL